MQTDIHSLSAFKPALEKPDVLIIAGEHSGDEHASILVSRLLEKKSNLKIYALGGSNLKAAGAHILWDMTESSVVGFVEVVKNYGYFKKLFSLITKWIEDYQPATICFVDYPGFNLRLANYLYERNLAALSGGTIKLIYYIGPQIWAWKAKRRFLMAKMLNALALIFPFELDAYKDTSLPCSFVGHPFVSDDYKLKLHYNALGPILLLPGSRKSPVKKIWPILLKAFEAYLLTNKNEKAVVVIPSLAIEKIVLEYLNKYPHLKPYIILKTNREEIFAKAALCSSGTMSLICALAEIPCAIVYKANWLTYFIGRVLVKIKYLGIVNIILKREACKEYLQGDAKVKDLAKKLSELSQDKAAKHANSIAKQLIKKLKGTVKKQVEDWFLKVHFEGRQSRISNE